MRRMLLVALAAGTLLSASALAQMSVPPQLAPPPPGIVGLQPAASAQVSPAARAQLNQIASLRTSRGVNVARMQANTLRTARVGSSVQFNVAPSVNIIVRTLSTEQQGSLLIFRGEVQGAN